MNDKFFVRNFDADNLIESFFISAITSILAIRFFLTLTGFPEITLRGLHIAHVIWGGLLMLIAFTVVFNFLSKSALFFAAIVGGVGFGIFLDELGKFVTKDNNYFFEPTIALIYMTFVILYILNVIIGRYGKISQTEYLVNGIEILKQAVIDDLDPKEKKETLEYLNKADPKDPLVISLKEALRDFELAKNSKPSFFSQLRSSIRNLYWSLSKRSWFIRVVIFIFIIKAVLALGHDIAIFRIYFGSDLTKVSFPTLAESVFSILSATLIFIGLFRIYFSRIAAFQMFKDALLVSIFLTQFFTFYREQFFALLGLLFDLSLLVILQYSIAQEKFKTSS